MIEEEAIHVKKGSRRSNVLSHFFKQGSNSALNLKRFPDVANNLVELVRDEWGQPIADELIETLQNNNKWTIEYWIADTPRADGSFNIPFFSKVSLREEIFRLHAMDYNVAIRFIGHQP